jgi:folate-dependent phosphoribosylglycinamide formyltransferase PurN
MTCPLMIITGDKLRHIYFAQYLLNRFTGAVLVLERQHSAPWGAHISAPSKLEQRHFNDFADTERYFFSENVADNASLIESRTVYEIEAGTINTLSTIADLQRYNPCVVATLSTSILKKSFIESFSCIINYHAGLSPYYRGSGTNVFPIINREPEYIGTTIHYIDTGIDSGDIIVQGRPNFTVGDDSHILGCKAHIVGTRLMGDAISACLSNLPPKGIKQNLHAGTFYAKADFNDSAINKLRAALEEGVVDEYARNGPLDISIITEVSV